MQCPSIFQYEVSSYIKQPALLDKLLDIKQAHSLIATAHFKCQHKAMHHLTE
jgi:hypothetical protein